MSSNSNNDLYPICRQVKFHGSTVGGTKRVAEEEIIEVEDLAAKQAKPSIETSKTQSQLSIGLGTFKRPQTTRPALGAKSLLANLVKRKPIATISTTTSLTASTDTNVSTTETSTNKSLPAPSKPAIAVAGASTTNALSLLGGYDSNSDSDASD